MKVHEKIKIILSCRRELFIEIKKWVDLVVFRKEWRQLNPFNGTTASNKFDCSKVFVGTGTYGEIKVIGFDNPEEKLIIGNYCSIAGDVTFLLGGEHVINSITTFPFAHHVMNLNVDPTPTKGPIIVEDDVWLCHGTMILSGVKIGKGAVIGAGSVISKDVPKYAIVVNNNIIKRKRFDDDVIEELIKIDLGKMKDLDINKQEYLMKNPITRTNIEMITDWFCKI